MFEIPVSKVRVPKNKNVDVGEYSKGISNTLAVRQLNTSESIKVKNSKEDVNAC